MQAETNKELVENFVEQKMNEKEDFKVVNGKKEDLRIIALREKGFKQRTTCIQEKMLMTIKY